jgi:hypothetical protein
MEIGTFARPTLERSPLDALGLHAGSAAEWARGKHGGLGHELFHMKVTREIRDPTSHRGSEGGTGTGHGDLSRYQLGSPSDRDGDRPRRFAPRADGRQSLPPRNEMGHEALSQLNPHSGIDLRRAKGRTGQVREIGSQEILARSRSRQSGHSLASGLGLERDGTGLNCSRAPGPSKRGRRRRALPNRACGTRNFWESRDSVSHLNC